MTATVNNTDWRRVLERADAKAASAPDPIGVLVEAVEAQLQCASTPATNSGDVNRADFEILRERLENRDIEIDGVRAELADQRAEEIRRTP